MTENEIANKVIGIAIEIHKKHGFLINVNVVLLKNGIKRVINGIL